jgi:hypothetical protein
LWRLKSRALPIRLPDIRADPFCFVVVAHAGNPDLPVEQPPRAPCPLQPIVPPVCALRSLCSLPRAPCLSSTLSWFASWSQSL